jgi:hypothetical protein
MAYAAEIFPVVSRDEDIKIMRRMTIYEAVGFDREKFIAAYYRHHADVRRYFAGRSDLLDVDRGGRGMGKAMPVSWAASAQRPLPTRTNARDCRESNASRGAYASRTPSTWQRNTVTSVCAPIARMDWKHPVLARLTLNGS